MRAVRLHPPGGIENLRLDELQPPRPRPGQVPVRVHAAAITRDELEWPTDRLPAIPSYELSGVVAEDTDGFSAGEAVFALTPFDRDGVAADYALVPVEVLAPKPRSLSHVQAAALPMPGLSAWQALVVHGRLQPGERIAVTGARGGVGHLAVQLARSQGATLVEEGEPCDLLFDTAGGETLARSAGQAGRIVTVAAETPGAHYFVVEPNREQLLELARLVDTGELRPEIDSIFPLAQARAAFTRSAARGKRGKVVLRGHRRAAALISRPPAEEAPVDSHAIKGIAQTYFDAWRSRDFDRLRSILADDVSFRGPLGTTEGADATIAGLRQMAENVMRDLDISLMAVDGSDVLTWYDLHTATTEPLPTVNWSHVENGLISRIRAVFDPRPLFPPKAGS